MIWFVICYDTSVNILYHLGVVFIKLPFKFAIFGKRTSGWWMNTPALVCWMCAICMIHAIFSLQIKCNESCWRLLIWLSWLNISSTSDMEGYTIWFKWFVLILGTLWPESLTGVTLAILFCISPTNLTTSWYLRCKC